MRVKSPQFVPRMLQAIGSEGAVVVMVRIKSLGLAIRRRSEQIDHRFGVEELPRLLDEMHGEAHGQLAFFVTF